MEAVARLPADIRPEEHRPQQLEIPRSPLAVAAAAARPQGPGLAAPPPHPEAASGSRPTFEHEPAPIRPEPGPPATTEPRPERRPGPSPPAAQPRAPAGEPERPRPGEHARPAERAEEPSA